MCINNTHLTEGNGRLNNAEEWKQNLMQLLSAEGSLHTQGHEYTSKASAECNDDAMI